MTRTLYSYIAFRADGTALNYGVDLFDTIGGAVQAAKDSYTFSQHYYDIDRISDTIYKVYEISQGRRNKTPKYTIQIIDFYYDE